MNGNIPRSLCCSCSCSWIIRCPVAGPRVFPRMLPMLPAKAQNPSVVVRQLKREGVRNSKSTKKQLRRGLQSEYPHVHLLPHNPPSALGLTRTGFSHVLAHPLTQSPPPHQVLSPAHLLLSFTTPTTTTNSYLLY